LRTLSTLFAESSGAEKRKKEEGEEKGTNLD
jgi:hypothetical protein